MQSIYQTVLDTLHVTLVDQSYVTLVEAMADNFVAGFYEGLIFFVRFRRNFNRFYGLFSWSWKKNT